MPVLVLAETRPGDRKGLNGVENRSYNENKEIIKTMYYWSVPFGKHHTHQ